MVVLAGTKYALGIKEASDWKNCHEEKRQKIGLRQVDIWLHSKWTPGMNAELQWSLGL